MRSDPSIHITRRPNIDVEWRGDRRMATSLALCSVRQSQRHKETVIQRDTGQPLAFVYVWHTHLAT